MAGAWQIVGPLMEACTPLVLDCSDANASTAPVIYPNPARVLGPERVPGVACSAGDPTPMLVIIGSRCALIDADNGAGCYWDNVKQVLSFFLLFPFSLPHISATCKTLRR
jgi:hypothetical protein